MFLLVGAAGHESLVENTLSWKEGGGSVLWYEKQGEKKQPS